MRRRKGEAVSLYCAHCSWSTELAMADTEESQVVACAHCGQSIYWHGCAQCDLRYVGQATPRCPICDDSLVDELSTE